MRCVKYWAAALHRRSLPFAIAAAILLLDRVTKAIIRARVGPWESFPVIPNFFNIVHAENPGVAFGLLADSTGVWRSVFLIGISVAVLAFISILLWRKNTSQDWTLRLGLACVLGGAAGNLIDRVVNGTVTDFLEVYSGSHYFPAFNVADSAITIGAGLLLLDMLVSKKSEPRGIKSNAS